MTAWTAQAVHTAKLITVEGLLQTLRVVRWVGSAADVFHVFSLGSVVGRNKTALNSTSE